MAYDAHLHADLYGEEAREPMLRKAFAEGIDGVVAVSMDPASCRTNEALAERFPGRVLPAYGHHPEQPPLPPEALEALCAWIAERRDRPFAIGEVGLPYYARQEAEQAGRPFDLAPYIAQLDRFVRLAKELDRPIALHAVYEDADLALDLLERHGVSKAHFHWFKGSPQTVSRIVRRGYSVSFTPDILYEPETRRLAASFPLELVMVETDGPWPFEGPYAGKPTEPGMVRDVVREIALLRGLPEAETERAAAARTRAFYGFR